jgi:hypothetical protein
MATLSKPATSREIPALLSSGITVLGDGTAKQIYRDCNMKSKLKQTILA